MSNGSGGRSWVPILAVIAALLGTAVGGLVAYYTNQQNIHQAEDAATRDQRLSAYEGFLGAAARLRVELIEDLHGCQNGSITVASELREKLNEAWIAETDAWSKLDIVSSARARQHAREMNLDLNEYRSSLAMDDVAFINACKGPDALPNLQELDVRIQEEGNELVSAAREDNRR
jgi:hypothetical protein